MTALAHVFARNEAPHHQALKAPSRWRWLLEGRAFYEFGFSLMTLPLLLRAPKGDGHGVLVIPGFLTTDVTTAPLRGYLRRLGYDARAWELGRNLGNVGARDSLIKRLETMVRETGGRVSVIGWSLGGILARDLAVERPDLVRSVISLGSPFSHDPQSSNIGSMFEMFTGNHSMVNAALRMVHASIFRNLERPVSMPATSIYSKADGIVDWHSCLIEENERSENLEVIGASHLGFAVHAPVLWAIADRLAQPEDRFRTFRASGPFACGYGDVARD